MSSWLSLGTPVADTLWVATSVVQAAGIVGWAGRLESPAPHVPPDPLELELDELAVVDELVVLAEWEVVEEREVADDVDDVLDDVELVEELFELLDDVVLEDDDPADIEPVADTIAGCVFGPVLFAQKPNPVELPGTMTASKDAGVTVMSDPL